MDRSSRGREIANDFPVGMISLRQTLTGRERQMTKGNFRTNLEW